MDKIMERVFGIRNFAFDGTIREETFPGVKLSLHGKKATIGYATKVQKARACFLLMQTVLRGKKDAEIEETPRFETVGPMLDMARGRVMCVEAIKEQIVRYAALGLNMLMIYTEDVFELEGYPFFGYQRGRYTLEELREIDDFAFEMGVEIIPCLETFGHLEQYLRWPEANPIKDTAAVLLAGEEKTYAFIEQQIRTVKSVFRSDRIHLGMDETHSLGQGKYKRLHGQREVLDIYFEHLDRVLKIARQYYKECMIWSDMIFTNPYSEFNLDFVLTQDRIDRTPRDLTLVFWDYYHVDYEFYNENMNRHDRFPNEQAFAGAVWTWDGIAPNLDYTLESMRPALKAAIEHNVKTIIATTWGDNCSCADYAHSLPGFAVFSEFCYKGENVTDEDVYAAAETVAGVDEALFHAISSVYQGYRGAMALCRGYLYGDPMIDRFEFDFDREKAVKDMFRAKRVIDRHRDYEYRPFFSALYACCAGRGQLMLDVRRAYDAHDSEELKRLADKAIPRLKAQYRRLRTILEQDWDARYKPFGFEMYSIDLAGAYQRLDDTARRLRAYANGEIPTLEELDEPVLSGINHFGGKPRRYMVTLV